MLAYSSISHADFILMGVVAAWKLEGGLGFNSVLFYLGAYTVSNVLAFGSLIAVGSYGKEAVSYADLAGVGRRHPWLALPFSLGILSLMGFPPTAGFFGKYYILLATVEAGGSMIWLALIAVLSSAVGAYYYLKVLVYLFMRQPEKDAPIAVPMRSGYVTAVLVATSYFVVRMGITPDTYLALASHVADASTVVVDWTSVLLDGGIAIVAGGIAAALTGLEPARRSSAAKAEPTS